jgi:YkoY family integral membrane protein
MFDQTFAPQDLATVAVLVVLEAALSIDNALVLGLLSGRLKPSQRMRALTYGLVGAFVLRWLMIVAAAYLLRWAILKLLGGIYLLWVGTKYFLPKPKRDVKAVEATKEPVGFWTTVAAIELTDVAFAVDSILAAIALVGPPPRGTPRSAIHPKLWVIVTGGMLGVIVMRFAAAIFSHLMERFPRLTRSAYLLVILIGVKMLIEWACDNPPQPPLIDFQEPNTIAFWVFWSLMAAIFALGFVPSSRNGGRKPSD